MARTSRDKLDLEKEKIDPLVGDEITKADADAIHKFANAIDPDIVRSKFRNADGEIKRISLATAVLRLKCLRIIARDSDIDLVSADVDEFNGVIDWMHDSECKKKSTLVPYQLTGRSFYGYHNFDVDPSDINIYSPDTGPKHDEQDLFTDNEIKRLREACGQSRNPYRNRALLELLIFTGQRISALLTLRIKDVNLDPDTNKHNAYIFLNEDYDQTYGGLKNATVRGRKRPIFGARKYVRDLISNHPNGDDPNEWLFVPEQDNPRSSIGDHWCRRGATSQLERLADVADVDKPVNPHNFRHYCATVLRRDYGVNLDDLRMLLGHAENSTMLEDTYQHLIAADHIAGMESALGFTDSDESRSLTPSVCPTCGEILENDWRQCPYCGEIFGPREAVEEAAEEAKEEAMDTALSADLSAEDQVALRAILDAVDDPGALAESLIEISS